MDNIESSKIANLPTIHGSFKIKAFKVGHKEHLAVFTDPIPALPLVRIHSECLTGDAIGSMKCDCRDQLNYALDEIGKNGGILLYLRQEGRDIGLLNKVNAYALQDSGLDTVEANHQLGFDDDMRDYEIVELILADFGIKEIKLLTNNPKKMASLTHINIIERVPIVMNSNKYNEGYLDTKSKKMGHIL